MEKIALNTVEKYNMLDYGDKIIVGLSGGADSVALVLTLLSFREKYNLEIFIVHINHGIRGEEGSRDEEFSRNFAKVHGLWFKVFYFDVPKIALDRGISHEEAGREVRYLSFNECLKEVGGNKIAVAHNQNDQAETIIMRLCRGTGLTGIRGISPKRGNIIRPLIDCSRIDIEKYLFEKNQKYCVDSTNLESMYTRNKIRLEVLPILEKGVNKNAVKNMAKTAQLIDCEEDLLETLTIQTYKTALVSETTDTITLKIQALKDTHLSLKRRVIRLCINKLISQIKDISYTHIDLALKLIDTETGKMLDLPKKLQIYREYENLVIKKNNSKENVELKYVLKEDKPVFIEKKQINVEISKKIRKNLYTKAFDCDKIQGSLTLRNRLPKDIISLGNGRGHKKLKDYFIDKKVPRGDRDTLLVLAMDNQILWLENHNILNDFHATDNTKEVLYFNAWEADHD
ncbi:MAG: tRNA lysidine(34) synthetase TilS [Anaerotignaceae bacterium]